MNVMSTTASVVVGLYNDSVRVLPSIVDPEAKYHSDAVEREHGLSDQPSGPATDSVASTPPPSRSTVVATRFPPASSPGASTLSERAGTTIATVLAVPVSPTALSVPATACDVVLTRLTVVAAVDPGLDVPPAQYQADDSTATGATEEIGAGGAAAGRVRCSDRSATPAPTAATRIARQHGHPDASGPVGGRLCTRRGADRIGDRAFVGRATHRTVAPRPCRPDPGGRAPVDPRSAGRSSRSVGPPPGPAAGPEWRTGGQ